MIALTLSLLANLVLIAAIGLAALESAEFRKKTLSAAPVESLETVATIFAVPAENRPPAEPAPVAEKRFARTSEEQAARPEANPAFIGERDTRATSDRAPVSSAPPLPSQAGVEPKDETDLETTESDYQDGSLSGSAAAVPVAETIPPPAETAATEPTERPAPVGNPPPPRESLMDGPNPVDLPVPRETAVNEEIKPTPEQQTAATAPPVPSIPEMDVPAETLRPSSARDPAFSGNQRKAAIVGSISRTGTSALDVADSPLGRYQAVISRAVEQEWQRNCVRHRDFITPGFLTVRFFVEPSGRIRSVQFVGDMETGEIQKGFTLNSIRNAEIPAMPRGLRGEYEKEPLELIFRFYF